MARVRQSPPAASEGASPVPPPAKAASLPAVRPKGAGSARRKKPAVAAPAALNAAVGGQVALIAGLAASAFTVVALASYDANDVSLSVAVAGADRTENLVGPAGSYLADALYQGFGYAAWTVLFVGVSLALRLAGRPSGGWMKRVLGAVGFALLATGLQLGLADLVDGTFEPGGLVGLFFAKALTDHLGRVGGGLAVTTGLVAIGTILFRIDWQPLAARAVERLQHGAPAAVRGVGALGVGAVRASVRAGSAGIEALRDRASGADADDEDEEIEEEEVSAPVTRASNPRGTVP
ncbi:MAG: DNA translocase FtsK 4TM domain-containing protein, partial [Myxococcota bacterium]